MPSPAAAALIAGLVWVVLELGLSGADVKWPACLLTIFAGVTMVSNIPYYSGKEINLRKSVPFMVIAVIALGFALVSFHPPGVLFALFLLYALSGYLVFISKWNSTRKSERKNLARSD
jgi:CDP-diacylglycerol--serine O-phosphatidyltransferase